MSWADVAKKYGYKNENSAHKTVTQDYPVVWRQEYERARELMLDGLEANTIKTMVELLEGADKTYVRQQAGDSLLRHLAKMRGQKIEVTNPDGSLKPSSREIIHSSIIGIVDLLSAFPDAKKELIEKLNGRHIPG